MRATCAAATIPSISSQKSCITSNPSKFGYNGALTPARPAANRAGYSFVRRPFAGPPPSLPPPAQSLLPAPSRTARWRRSGGPSPLWSARSPGPFPRKRCRGLRGPRRGRTGKVSVERLRFSSGGYSAGLFLRVAGGIEINKALHDRLARACDPEFHRLPSHPQMSCYIRPRHTRAKQPVDFFKLLLCEHSSPVDLLFETFQQHSITPSRCCQDFFNRNIYNLQHKGMRRCQNRKRCRKLDNNMLGYAPAELRTEKHSNV